MGKRTLCLLFVASVATAPPARDKKAFSLFSVVTFPNKECTSQMTPSMNGICVTADECQNAGDVVATKSGNCASGFGVCCLRTVEGNPGATITTALTYIQSPDFPAAVTAVVPDSFSLGGPAAATAGNSGVGSAECTQSYLEVVTTQSLAGAVSPRICGGILNAINDQASTAPVDTVGFIIGVVSDGDNGNAAAAGVGTGFDLLYTQRGCP